MRTLTELNTLILGWAAERQILKNSTPFAQAKKTAEEVMELIQADAKQNINEIKDAIGDIYVTLVVGLGCGGNALISDQAIRNINEAFWTSTKTTLMKHFVCESLLQFYAYVGDDDNFYRMKDIVIELMGLLSCIAKSDGLTLVECVDSAYEQIKDRKGYLREDGVFVKETT